jgi:outer membrane protein assembly factor BamB
MSAWTLVRVDGMDGSLNADFSWRWTPTSEERFLDSAGRPSERTGAAKPTEIDLPSELQPGDWPGFRGADRDGRASGVTFDSDWGSHPPRELWRRRVGPGWSSFTVVGPYLFTQEQQGEDEAVVCYRLTDGQPCWVNTHRTRFSEVVSGAGPRATPTFHQGRLYTMGANGTVQCLDATDGHAIWSREAVADTDAEVPIWGFASSPLVVGNLAVVFAGGTKGRSVVAYRCDNGGIAWVGGDGRLSYSSPQLVRFGESELILMATETGLQALEPGSGRSAWRHDWPTQSMRIVQPQLLGHGQVLFASGYGTGTRLLRIGRRENGWDVAQAWSTKDLEPYFNDSVGHQGYVYGFDGKVLACIDLQTGKRCWKGGRYGYGQILLLPEMDLLLVLSETGEAVLVRADPQEHRELGRFQAVNGKTWNHPVIAHGRLLVRNSNEAACFELIAGSPEKR